jgi:hypothetical protein
MPSRAYQTFTPEHTTTAPRAMYTGCLAIRGNPMHRRMRSFVTGNWQKGRDAQKGHICSNVQVRQDSAMYTGHRLMRKAKYPPVSKGVYVCVMYLYCNCIVIVRVLYLYCNCICNCTCIVFVL